MESSKLDYLFVGAFGALVAGTSYAIAKSLTAGEKPKEKKKPKAEEKKKPAEDEEDHAEEGKLVEVESFVVPGVSKLMPNPIVAFHDQPKTDRIIIPEASCIPDNAFTFCERQYKSEADLLKARKYVKAGPKTHIYYDPKKVKAAVVTCGGLCPGENVVIREVVMMLWYSYGVREIYGVKYGYEGFWKKVEGKDCYVKLVPSFKLFPGDPPADTMEVVDLHNLGGTALASSRGGFDGEKIVDALVEKGINQLYGIGGDGTHRGLLAISKIIKKRKLEITVIGIPKTIDNDMPYLDKTFGFESAVEAAIMPIQCADVEANCAEYGVGLIKLMGRNAGHIAMMASLASRDVNICLVPEFPYDIYGPKGLLAYIIKRLKDRHHCVIVAAEGASNGVRDLSLSPDVKKDASGNIIPPDICEFLKKEIVKYGKDKHNMEVTLKFIDPSYIIRSVPANSDDRYLCAVLAEYAAHAAMAGFTNCTVGTLRTYTALIPFSHITRKTANLIEYNDRNWQRLLQSTGQPPFLNE